jgi:hypothetical protein
MNDEMVELKEFLTDLRSGVSFQELVSKYSLSHDHLNKILGKLGKRDLSAFLSLWQGELLSESQFMRAFSEISEDLKRKD